MSQVDRADRGRDDTAKGDAPTTELGALQAMARAVSRSLLPDEILQAALRQLVALMGADLGYIYLREQGGPSPLCSALQGASANIAQQFADHDAAASLQQAAEAQAGPAFVDDLQASPLLALMPRALLEEGYASCLLLGLHSRSMVGGMVLAAHDRSHFPRSAAALLEALGEQVGIALDNACLYAEARQRAEEMRSLYDMSVAAATLDPAAILRLIGEHIMRLFDASCFFVALVDRDKSELRFVHVIDQGQVLPPFSAPLDEPGLTGYVLASGQPLLIADMEQASSLPATPIHFGPAARSWLGVPLVVKGQPIGVMSVQTYVPSAFDEDDQRLLSLAAQQAASALENARLFQETLALERRYHTLLEGLNDGYAVVQDGRLAFANARLANMLGVPLARLQGGLPDLLRFANGTQEGVASWAADGARPESAQYRTRLLRSDGSELAVEVGLNPIEYDGRPALAVLCRDISGQVRLEAQLVQAEKLSAVGQLVSGVAHELNNPLTTIKGYAQLLQGERLSPVQIEDLRRMEEAADRCRRIVRDLLTFARRYEPELCETDLNELLRRTVDLRAYELRVRNVAVEWHLDPHLPLIQADPHRLQQVILNLIFNAEQALLSAGEGGLICIRSQALPGGQHVRFEISDSGPGIRPEHLARIFDPFFTTKEVGMGTGLGLSISYGIVKEHGGRIWAESRFGAGATFYVELPLARQPASQPGDGL